MRRLAFSGLFAATVGLVLAQFLVLLYSHWFFAEVLLVKTILLAVPLTIGYGLLLLALPAQRRLLLGIGLYWLATYTVAAIAARSLDLSRLTFVGVLNYEAAFVWLPVLALCAGAWLSQRRRRAAAERSRKATARQLGLRRRLREQGGLALATAGAGSTAPATVDSEDEPEA